MDTSKLIEILKGTIDPNQREAAEKQLEQVHKIIGFAPCLLQVIMNNVVEMPVRQAGVIYLKNMVAQYWADPDPAANNGVQTFNIHEQDRAMIRDAIVDAVVVAPELVRVQLAVCVNNIVKHDFPGRWTGIVDKVSIYLQSPDSSGWIGALLCMYQLVKIFEYKKPEERGPLNEAMGLLFPLIYQRCIQLMPDSSEHSVVLQRFILKIFYALVQFFMPLNLLSRESFAQWMQIFRDIVERHVPEATLQVDEDERPDLAWWKCKKWAMHILVRLFERYGSPGNVSKEYESFADYYLKTFSLGILEVLLKVLQQYQQNVYISPRVLQQTLNYLNTAVSHAYSWKFMKPHMMTIIQEVIFKLLCHTEEDDQLWKSDPQEYIRMKYDVFEDFTSPVMAAQTLLHSACKKRKEMLPKSMAFVMTVLNNPNTTVRQKDGGLRMVGSVAEILLKKKVYKDQVEAMLVTYVFPAFQSQEGHMRARACWVLHYFNAIKFKDDNNLFQALNLLQNSLLNDMQLPVKVEAAIGLQQLLFGHEKAQKFVEPQIQQIALELLKIIRETENDDLTSVMQKIVCSYTEKLTPIAVQMTQHLVETFTSVIESGEDGSDERAITAMGVLSTIDTILTVMEDQKTIMDQLEPVVLNVVALIFSQNVIEFYEEAMSLIYSLTSNSISPSMWRVLEMVYQAFQKDAFDYFVDMMPALHNFVNVDVDAFVSNEAHLLAIYNMCKAVLNGEAGEDAETHAAKLLEVVILKCKGRIDPCIPSFIELVLERLIRKVNTSELRTMCLQVVIAALYYNPNLLLETLGNMKVPNGQESITAHFIQQWISDTDCFLGLHDRKLCIVGLCTLMNTPQARNYITIENAKSIIPSLILLFDGLKRAYAFRAQEEGESDDEEDDENDFDPDVLETDEDEIDEDGAEYLEALSTKIKAKSPFPITSATIEEDDDEGLSEDSAEETILEGYTTPLDDDDCPIDEYVMFKEVILSIQATDPNWYNTLTSPLTTDDQKSLQEVFLLADQRRAAAESKKIEKSGGYVFQNQTVPSTFNFGGSPLS